MACVLLTAVKETEWNDRTARASCEANVWQFNLFFSGFAYFVDGSYLFTIKPFMLFVFSSSSNLLDATHQSFSQATNDSLTRNPRWLTRAPKVSFYCQSTNESKSRRRGMQTKASSLFQQALSSFFSAKQCMTACGNNSSLCGKRQNRVEAVVRSGRADETKRDEKDDLHCGVFSHPAIKDTGEESSGPLPAEEQSHPSATTTSPIRAHQQSIVNAAAPNAPLVLRCNHNISGYQNHLTFT